MASDAENPDRKASEVEKALPEKDGPVRTEIRRLNDAILEGHGDLIDIRVSALIAAVRAEQQGGNAVVGKVIESPPFDYSEGFEEQAQHDKSIELIKAKARLEALKQTAGKYLIGHARMNIDIDEARAEVKKLTK